MFVPIAKASSVVETGMRLSMQLVSPSILFIREQLLQPIASMSFLCSIRTGYHSQTVPGSTTTPADVFLVPALPQTAKFFHAHKTPQATTTMAMLKISVYDAITPTALGERYVYSDQWCSTQRVLFECLAAKLPTLLDLWGLKLTLEPRHRPPHNCLIQQLHLQRWLQVCVKACRDLGTYHATEMLLPKKSVAGQRQQPSPKRQRVSSRISHLSPGMC